MDQTTQSHPLASQLVDGDYTVRAILQRQNNSGDELDNGVERDIRIKVIRHAKPPREGQLKFLIVEEPKGWPQYNEQAFSTTPNGNALFIAFEYSLELLSIAQPVAQASLLDDLDEWEDEPAQPVAVAPPILDQAPLAAEPEDDEWEDELDLSKPLIPAQITQPWTPDENDTVARVEPSPAMDAESQELIDGLVSRISEPPTPSAEALDLLDAILDDTQPPVAESNTDEAEEPEREPLDASRVQNVIANSTCIMLQLRKPGNTRKIGSDKVEVDSDKGWIRVNKQLLDSKELKLVVALDQDLRKFMYSQSSPVEWISSGSYLIPLASLENITKSLNEYETKRQELITAFMAVYQRQVEEARERLKSNFDPNDYPEPRALRKQFSMDYRLISIGVPNEGTIGRELYEREKAKSEKDWQDTSQTIQAALRGGFQGMIDHLNDRLTPGPDGKKKVFRDTAVTNILEFLDTFNNRNLTNDAQLEILVGQAKNLLSGVQVKDIRKDPLTSSRILDGFSKIKEQMDSMMVDKPSRKFELEEDED